jgi:preprotein translocase subunit YajC
LGRINEIGDKVVVLEIAPNVRVRVERSQITALSSYGKPPVGKNQKAE